MQEDARTGSGTARAAQGACQGHTCGHVEVAGTESLRQLGSDQEGGSWAQSRPEGRPGHRR